ncbi:MAG: menaquinone biosynthesis decarboxylase [Deltaproteobacteria bacterium]|nr:menaquinone biosynthesis decarboxylase [Deltaproteobacteria bacterium]NCS73272.1 menaquinone biosynthesis decarboxylase [Deltaproteobacteria bacterium]OIP62487.1 MAG: menaquinone biosynthesis decarboxylase [Nitrospirae bacterium CG2_30_70_394]PJB95158.1 MAG: menaquinone biosynthesis decarboxylase [Nitrospirae bacterium CG_4_9_14_0_8_um_filter_70_14]
MAAPLPRRAYADLHDFVHALEEAGELIRVPYAVDPVLEIAALADGQCKLPGGGKALLFERVKGAAWPVAINLFGSHRRICMALGVESLEEPGQRILDLLAPPAAGLAALKSLGRLRQIAHFFPKRVKSAPCKEVIDHAPDLNRLGVITAWPDDGGPFISLPLVFTRSPAGGPPNVGMYRMQLYDGQTTGMHWHIHKHGAAHLRAAGQAGTALPVAVALGGDPALIYAATAPLPDDLPEVAFAGFLRNRPVEMVAAETIPDLLVPAHADFILEGYVEPAERRMEGPYGDHTGYYSLPEPYPVFHLTCLTRRREPLYPTIIVGRPPMEDDWLGKATERIFLPLIRLQLPEVVDLHLPFEGVFHNLVLVSVNKRFPGHARKVMHALWGLGQMQFAKCIVVVDGDVDVQKVGEVAFRVANNVDWKRDITVVEGPLDALDHSSPQPRFGGKIGIDATRKLAEEGHPRPWPGDLRHDPALVARLRAAWAAAGLEEVG